MAYSFSHAVTIDESKCGTVDSTDFPFLFNSTIAALRTVANGGSVTSASGFDIAFFSDSGLTTALDFEIDRYTATTGEYVAWVRIPTLSASVNTVIYIAYGDAGITTSQEDIPGTWNANDEAVYHLRNGTTLSAVDSTVNAFNGTLTNTPTAVAGQIDGAGNFVRTSSQWIDMGAKAVAKNRGQMTISAWVKVTTSASARKGIITITNNSTLNRCSVYVDNSASAGVVEAAGRAGDAESAQTVVTGAGALVSGVWTLIHAVFNYATDSILIYLDGAAVSTTGTPAFTAAATSNTDSANFEIGSQVNGGLTMNGDIDEVRVSHTALSASWILASYNNQKTPSTFYTVAGGLYTQRIIHRNQAVNRAATY